VTSPLKDKTWLNGSCAIGTDGLENSDKLEVTALGTVFRLVLDAIEMDGTVPLPTTTKLNPNLVEIEDIAQRDSLPQYLIKSTEMFIHSGSIEGASTFLIQSVALRPANCGLVAAKEVVLPSPSQGCSRNRRSFACELCSTKGEASSATPFEPCK